MNGPERITAKSLVRLAVKFVRMFGGATFLMAFIRTDARFRQKILLTVSMANECGG